MYIDTPGLWSRHNESKGNMARSSRTVVAVALWEGEVCCTVTNALLSTVDLPKSDENRQV
jgi:hypothetical protein